jgi:TonB family protein
MQSKLPFILLLFVVPTRGEGQQPSDRSPVRQGGAWVLTTSRAEIPDQPTVTLELDALNVVRGPIVDVRPALYLRCDNEKLEAFVITGAVLDRDSDYRTTVRLRWADRPPVEEAWWRSTDYSAVFAPAPAAFIHQLVATPQLVLEFRPHDAARIAAQFDGEDLEAYIPRLKSSCRSFTDPPPAAARAPAPAVGAWADTVYAEAEVDEKAELLSSPPAEYPWILRRAGIQGRVVVQVVIDTLGRVEPGSRRVVSSSNPGFDEPALNAVREAVFRPARVHGRVVRVRVRAPIEFNADRP